MCSKNLRTRDGLDSEGAVSCLEGGQTKVQLGNGSRKTGMLIGKGTCTREEFNINLAWLRHCKQQEEAGRLQAETGVGHRCCLRTN